MFNIQIINELIDKEMEFAKSVNPAMAMGMSQVKKVLNDYYNSPEAKCVQRLHTPFGLFKATYCQHQEYPAIDIHLVDKDHNELDIVASVEYNPENESIATYSYSEFNDEFKNKTIYKK